MHSFLSTPLQIVQLNYSNGSPFSGPWGIICPESAPILPLVQQNRCLHSWLLQKPQAPMFPLDE